MKKKKFIFGLSCLAIITICTLNLQNSFNVSYELGYANLANLISINSASAEESGGSCKGTSCDSANGNQYGDFELNGILKCCGGATPSAGKKTS